MNITVEMSSIINFYAILLCRNQAYIMVTTRLNCGKSHYGQSNGHLPVDNPVHIVGRTDICFYRRVDFKAKYFFLDNNS